jgi:hypothetical protein
MSCRNEIYSVGTETSDIFVACTYNSYNTKWEALLLVIYDTKFMVYNLATLIWETAWEYPVKYNKLSSNTGYTFLKVGAFGESALDIVNIVWD